MDSVGKIHSLDVELKDAILEKSYFNQHYLRNKSFSIDGKNIIFNDELEKALNAYSNEDKGSQFQNTELFQLLNCYIENEVLEDMICCFALIYGYISSYIDEDSAIEYLISNFYDTILLDFYGNFNDLPKMYFLSKDDIEVYKTFIDKLYHLGILHKLTLSKSEEFTFYYVPFRIHNVSMIKDESLINSWIAITREFNFQLKSRYGKNIIIN